MTKTIASFVCVAVAIAMQAHGAAAIEPPAKDQPYSAWLEKLSAKERAAVRVRCAKYAVDADALCDGIGPPHIPAPPPVLLQRGGWFASLTSAQQLYVEDHCDGRHTDAALCVGHPPLENELPSRTRDEDYPTWRAGLTKRQKQRADTACRRSSLGSYEWACGGIGPLHVPVPPDEKSAGMRRGGRKTWLTNLNVQQRKWVLAVCTGQQNMYSQLCGATPLVVVFYAQPVSYTRGGEFSFTPGQPQRSDWPTAATPWLVLERDGSGAIESGAELFGSGTTLPDGTLACNGFEALAVLDENHDGRIDARDPNFAELQLWSDTDRDRKSTPNELRPAAAVLESISLSVRIDPRCDARDNCERERVSMVWRDGHGVARKGEVVDVYLPER